MKKLYTLLVVALIGFLGNAQIINIPDANFKAKLLEADTSNYIAMTPTNSPIKIDSNNDGEIQISEALTVYKLNINSSNVADITGLENFTNLTNFSSAHNQVSGSLNLSSLSNLKTFDVSDNLLTAINITGLNNLETIGCSGNQITALNLSGHANLKYLTCNYNQLTSLNFNGLTSLIRIECENNQLTSVLLSNLNNLDYATFQYNQLNTITLTGLPNFHQLLIEYNQLTTLDISGLPNFQNLWSSQNQLISINLNNLPNLRFLRCQSNFLTSLNVSGLTSLQSLDIYNNQITSLDLNSLQNIQDLNCGNNLLTTLDVSSLKNLQSLNCFSNNLTSLFIKNGINETILNIWGNPNIQYICADEDQLTSVESLVSSEGYTCAVNSYCSFLPGGDFYTIHGVLKCDANLNGCETSDVVFPNSKLLTSNGTTSSVLITNNSGNYTLPVQSGTYTITPKIENPNYFTISPPTASVVFPEVNSFQQDFCITPNGNHQDVQVVLLPINAPRPGVIAKYKLIYKNVGTITLDGFVKVNYSANPDVMVLSSSFPAVSSAVNPELQWDYTNLQPLESRIILFSMLLNTPTQVPPLNAGDDLGLAAVIYPVVGDEYYQDNHSQIKQKVVNSQDPNDKTCIEGDIVESDVIDNYVHYMIRFENTGTANAQNIVVKDMIDTTKFDINTLIPISGSHSFETKITNTNKVEFIFENIDLPFDDANNDGYVAYKIKTKPTLVVGDTFSNSASIYFDYNFPIITNTATTTIIALATQDFDFGTFFSIYPNPTEQELHIQTKGNIDMKSIELYNIVGQKVLAITNAESVSTIDVSNLKTGTYFIKVITNKGTANSKFIKE